MQKFKAAFAVAMTSVLCAIAPAHAATVFTYNGTVAGLSGFTVVQDFSGTTGNYSGTSAYTGMSGNYSVCAAGGTAGQCIFNSAGYTSNFAAVKAHNVATYTLVNKASEVAFDWGTTSSDNTLTVFYTDGSSDSPFNLTNANSGQANFNKVGVAVSAAPGKLIDRISFAAASNSFEFDNIAVKGAVPEPATWAMMIGGFGMVGAAMRRRRATGGLKVA